MKFTILFLIIFLYSTIKGSFEESLLLNLPTELLYTILYQLKFEERKNLLQTSHFWHQVMLDFILYEQNLETKKEKITKKFIDNNKLFLFFLDKVLKLHKIIKNDKNYTNRTDILIKCGLKNDKKLCIARGIYSEFFENSNDKKIDYLYWIDKSCPSDDVSHFPQIDTLIIDLLKKGQSWYLCPARFIMVKNIIIQAKGNIDTVIFPDYIRTAVIKSPVTNIKFNVPDKETMRKYGWVESYYYKMKELYNHFYITDLSIVVNDAENEDENNDNHWSKVLTKLPLKRLKITFYNEKSKRINSRKLELNNSLNVNLKELILKNCNRPVKLPEILEELYIINPEKNFQLYNFFNSFDKEQLLSVVAYKGKLVNAEKVSSVRGKHVMIESYLHDYIKIIHYNEVEKLTIKNSPTLKTIFISNNKNLKKENCFCDNPAVKWIWLD